MENNLDKIANDLYGKIISRFDNVTIGNKNAEKLYKKSDIPKARFFEFAYEENGNFFGMISITLDDDGIVILISGDLVDSRANHSAYKFIRSFRKFAKSRLLKFDVQNIGKDNLDKRDYQFKANKKELPIMESKMFGTNRISYQNLGEARLIVKHSQPINPAIAAGRSMHIQSIYVENMDGERFKYPYKHLTGARALAEHIKHGGNPYDAIGKHIIGLSEELNQLRKFKGYVNRQEQISESMGSVTDRVLQRIDEVKKEFTNLQRTSYYEQFVESFKEKEEKLIPESVMNDWIDRLTIKSFNEDLKSVFPYLYDILDENELPIREIDADDLLGEGFGQHGLQDSDLDKQEKEWEQLTKKTESLEPELIFESFIKSIMNESDEYDINHFNELLGNELPGGEVGAGTIRGNLEKILNYRHNQPDAFLELIDEIRHVVGDTTEVDEQVRNLLVTYINEYHGELVDKLPNLDKPTSDEQTSGEQEEPSTEQPSTEQPVSERVKSKFTAKFIKIKEAGGTLDTELFEGITIRDIMKESGINPMECGYTDEISAEQGNESLGELFKQYVLISDESVKELVKKKLRKFKKALKSIVGFWNKEEGNFTIGGTRASIKIEKEFPQLGSDIIKVLGDFIKEVDPSEKSDKDENSSDIEGLEQIKKNAGLL